MKKAVSSRPSAVSSLNNEGAADIKKLTAES
jgi:hypothetical protein